MGANFMSILPVMILFLGTGISFGTSNCKYQSNCGVVLDIKFPFRFEGDPGKCGRHYSQLTCEHNRTVLQLGSNKYFVEAINYKAYTLRVTDPRVHKGNCSTLPEYPSPANDYRPFYILYGPVIVFLTCKRQVKSPYYVDSAPCVTAKDFSHSSMYSMEENAYSYALVGTNLVASDIEDSCSIHKIIVSNSDFVSDSPNVTFSDIHDILASGFDLHFLPHYSYVDVILYVLHRPGTLLLDIRDLLAYGWREPFSYVGGTLRILRPAVSLAALTIAALAITVRAFVGIILLLALVIYKYRRRHLSAYDTIEEFLQSRNNLMPIRYSYKEIKKMTNNFKDKLGKGGYGDVYKGKTRSGHLVAIKILNEAKGSGQDFINEVVTIGRIYHINVVRLVGFCATASRRALVYDYMPNGSLDKFIFSEDPNGFHLSWERAHEIAVGVARGIAYLHQGCNMQILHFDIKPHNILLDDNFVPKISDFGLAKSYPTQKSAVTLTAVKGTLGYMAPELIYRKIGGVSYKADVYSFGQLLLAMAGRRKVNATDHSSQVYFASWIYDKIDRGQVEDLDLGDITKDEKNIAGKIILVALWCVQFTPADRPSMREVLEMLEGDFEDLKLPPKPLYYPPNLPASVQCSNQDTEDSTFPLCESIALEIEQGD